MNYTRRAIRLPHDNDILLDVIRQHPERHPHVIDLPYRLSSWALDEPDNGAIWLDQAGKAQAWAVLQSPFWNIDLAVRDAPSTPGIYSQVLAWADAMLEDMPIDSVPTDLVELLPPPQRRFGDDGSDPRRCWSHLATQLIEREYQTTVSMTGEQRRQRERLLLGDALDHVVHGKPDSSYHNALKQVGVRVETEGPAENPLRFVIVANQHAGLDRIFHGTPWAGGSWRRSLANLPMAFYRDTPKRFSRGYQSRGVWLHAEVLLPSLSDEEEAGDARATDRAADEHDDETL